MEDDNGAYRMNRIRLLSENVANQIAAGEVVERPASVVKELVENALDASATRVTVEIQSGGRSLIRVTDDGCGMSRDDALLCLERHATSKIKAADDLRSIMTMGFRGEALPSIASVSRMSITTRERDPEQLTGTQIIIHGGKILEVKEAGCAPGTSIEVRQIFFNLPARRKFLRSDETERAHIQHYLTLAALAYPGVAMNFIQDGRTIWQLPACETSGGSPLPGLQERMRALYSGDFRLLPIDITASESETWPGFDDDNGSDTAALRVWGYIGAPGVSRATREDQNIFVNRRPIENRGLNFALLEGYHTALMKGRFPVCCLFIEIDPGEVDVNIHPSKREVKFHREMLIRRFVTNAVRQALHDFHPAQSSAAIPQAPLATAASERAPAQTSFEPSLSGSYPVRSSMPAMRAPDGFAPQPAPQKTLPTQVPPPLTTVAAPPQSQEAVVPTAQSTGAPVPLLQVPLRLLGVIGRLYVILESDRGLVLMDQHAAHERILFEQMLRRLEEEGRAPSQRLLLPQTIELAPRDTDFLRQQIDTLSRLGVGLSEFGERTFLLDALPPFVHVQDGRRFVLELIDELKETGDAVNPWRLGEDIVAKTVCRHAVKANDPLAEPELEKLVEELRHCQMPYTCPHGRPTLIELNFRELEKKFGRVQ